MRVRLSPTMCRLLFHAAGGWLVLTPGRAERTARERMRALRLMHDDYRPTMLGAAVGCMVAWLLGHPLKRAGRAHVKAHRAEIERRFDLVPGVKRLLPKFGAKPARKRRKAAA